jgi:hypothetical protein
MRPRARRTLRLPPQRADEVEEHAVAAAGRHAPACERQGREELFGDVRADLEEARRDAGPDPDAEVGDVGAVPPHHRLDGGDEHARDRPAPPGVHHRERAPHGIDDEDPGTTPRARRRRGPARP